MESVVKLKVENTEYDAKVKRAAQGLQHLEDACHKAGGTLADASKQQVAYARSLGSMETSAKTAKGQLRELTAAATDLTTVYRSLSDAEKNSAFGKGLQESITQLTERAGEAKDAIADIQAAVSNASSDTRGFDQITGAATTMTSAFEVGQGAAKLLGIDLGNNVEVLAKLQAAMAITNGLQTIQTNLQGQSALMQGVLAAQTSLATAAQTAFGAATGNATLAQTAFNVVAKANPYVLLATALVAATGALWAFANASSKSAEEQERLAKEAEEAEQKVKENRDTMTNAAMTYAKSASKLDNLSQQYKKTNNEASKTQILKEAQSEFKKLGIECNGVGQAQNLLVNYTPKIVKALDLQAQAAALAAVAMKEYEKSFSALMENGYDVQGARILAGSNANYRALTAESNSLQSQASALLGGFTGGSSGGGRSGGNSGGSTTSDNPLAFQRFGLITMDDETKMLLDDIKRNNSGKLSLGLGISDLQKAMGFGEVGDGKRTFTEFDFEREKWIKENTPEKEKANIYEESKNLISGVQDIGNGIKSLGIDLGEGFDKTLNIVQSIMTITQGVQTVLGVIQAFNTVNETAQTVSLADIAANTSVMAVNSFSGWVPFFAHGGVVHAASGFVGGRSYSGDNIPALLNSGEVVLNQAQTANLATKLNDAHNEPRQTTAMVDGEKVLIAINNYLGATGRGQIVVSR